LEFICAVVKRVFVLVHTVKMSLESLISLESTETVVLLIFLDIGGWRDFCAIVVSVTKESGRCMHT
jgi:hypothetical protein